MAGQPDIVIIGSGIGGATIAAGLARSGAAILILERGERLADRRRRTATTRAIFRDGHFRPKEMLARGRRAVRSIPATTTMSAATRNSTAPC